MFRLVSTNSSTGWRWSSTDLTFREFCRLSRVSQLVARSLSSSRLQCWNVASSAVGRRLWWFFPEFRCTQRDDSEAPVLFKVFIWVVIQGHSGFHPMVVNHRSELVSIPDGNEKRLVWFLTPRSLSGTCARRSGAYPLSHVVHSWFVGQREDLKDSIWGVFVLRNSEQRRSSVHQQTSILKDSGA